ncbi:MAG: hypothetical protein IKN57_05175, partial [Parasporobacterium sp.]|nr:hypothetical protein [Parasporobacterium sp.]
YYATYCAAFLSGYSHEESMQICYGAQFVDLCSSTLLHKIGAPRMAATMQLQLEMMDARTDYIGIREIIGIWSSFHFLPCDLHVQKKWRTKKYMNKYRLICGPNGTLVRDTVLLAKDRTLPRAGIAMHVLADTWAHRYFAGVPSLVINNTGNDFYEIISDEEGEREQKIRFRHNPSAADDLEKGLYTNSIYQGSEYSIMNLGHGRAGHLPDYSFMKYRYMPAWNEYRIIVKDNPDDYLHAFCQMIHALKFLRGDVKTFETGLYDFDAIKGYEERIGRILRKRQLIASKDWKVFGEELSGETIEEFDLDKYQEAYVNAPREEKSDTYLGQFFEGAIAQKEMVCDQIHRARNTQGFWKRGGSIS